MSNKLNEILKEVARLGSDMTDDQAVELMDRAKSELSISEIEVLMANCTGPMFAECCQFDAEMGGLSRY